MQRSFVVIAIVGGLILGYMWDKQNARISQLETQVTQVQKDTAIIKQILLENSAGTPIAYTKKDFDCLVRNIYYEAGVEDTVGKFAVAQVTINRVKLGYWGNSICKVVYAKAQFSWTKVKKRAWTKPKNKTWNESVKVAQQALTGTRVKPLKKALFYHADYVDPNWRDHSKYIAKIGKHIFYTQAKGSNLKI